MKQKTKKAAKKRFQASASGKVRRMSTGQAHFNARENGHAGRKKHRDKPVEAADLHRIARLLPHN